MKHKSFFILTLLLLSLLGCSATLSRTSYLAKVNQDIITLEDLKYEFKKRHGGHEKFLTDEVATKKFLIALVDQTLLIQEAYRMGIQEETDIQESTNNFQKKLVTEYLLKKEVEDKSKATDEEIWAIFEQKIGELVLVQQIVVLTKEEAESILKRFQAGEDFESLAREKSIAQSKIYGGRMPYLGWGSMDTEWERIAFSLSPGDVSPVFKSRIGYEILRLIEKKTSPKPNIYQVRDKIKSILERRKLEARGKEFMDSIRNKYTFRFTDFELSLENMKKVKEEKKEDPVATWNGGNLSAYSLASQLNFELLSSLPTDQSKKEITGVLGEVVNEKLLEKEARERGFDKVPEVVKKVQQHQEDLMLNKLYANYILKDMKVTEEELRDYYAQNPNEFMVAEKRRVAHILIDLLYTAKEVVKKLKEGESFEDLAKSYSKDMETANRGGEVGWIGKGEVLPSIEKVAFSLNTGEISDLVQTSLGYHIVKLLEIKPVHPLDYSQAKNQIEKKVLKKKRDEKIAHWVNQLKPVSKIEINEEGIKTAIKELERQFEKKSGE